ncbi:MAG: hypothetical protein JWR52_1141 [Marmoricola sp.]|nr:hypothetical protein [Marmoricola sp.]
MSPFGRRPWALPRYRGRWVLLVLITVLALLGVARLSVETTLRSFLPQGDPALVNYDQFASQFGGDPLVVLVRSDRDLGLFQNQEILKVLNAEGQLSKLPGVKTVYGPATMLNEIAGQAQQLILELTGRRDALAAQARALAKAKGDSAQQIRAAGATANAKFDARYGPVLVSGMPAGLPTLLNPQFATAVVFDDDGNPRSRWRFIVPDRSTIAILVRPQAGIDAHALSSIVSEATVIASSLRTAHIHVDITGSPALISAMSKQVQREGPWLAGGALLGVALCFLIGAQALPRRRRLAPVALTCMSAVVALGFWGWLGGAASLGVVAFAPIVLGIGAYYPTYFALGASPRTVATVALATASGLGTMVLSPLPVVRDLGAMLALGVLCAVGLALLARPMLNVSASPAAVEKSSIRANYSRRAVAAIRVSAVVLGLGAIAGWALFPSIGVRADVAHFAGGVSALGTANYAESILGSSGEVDLMMTGRDVTTPAALGWQQRADNAIALQIGDSMKTAASLTSILSFLGTSPTSSEVSAALRLMPPYLLSSVLNPERTHALTAYGVRVDDLSALRQTLQTAAADVPKPPAGYSESMVGLPVVLIRATQLVQNHRLLANLFGIAAPLIVFGIGLRRRADVLRAAAAALSATGLVFLGVSALGTNLDPLTVGLGALTSGIACEFTIVYSEAIASADKRLRCAVALVAVSSLVGYGVLIASGLTVIRGFGGLLVASIAMAAVTSMLTVEATTRRKSGTEAQINDTARLMEGASL